MDIKELKVRAYDLLAFIEQAQVELRAVNQKIAEASKPKEEVAETEKK